MAIKVMLIEDEAGMRLLLKKIIGKHPEFEVVAECEELTEAVIAFNRKKPEVVFLDIGIKGQNGIECAKILTDLNPKVRIIFATAHTEYMSEAFELYAFDYLVKPFDLERVNRTLGRIVEQMLPQACEPEEMFEVKETVLTLPEPARIFESHTCDCCGESAGAHWIRLAGDKKLCLDCWDSYDRFNV